MSDALHDVKRSLHEKINKYASKIHVGQYNGKVEPARTEGDVWEDENKTWTIKNGIKQVIPKLQDAKTPWWCPDCQKMLNSRIDMKFWRLRGKCHDCVLKVEGQMRLDGTWADYDQKLEMRNQMAWLKDKIVEYAYYLKELTSSTEIRHYNEETGALLQVDKFTIPVDKVRTDLQQEMLELNRILVETEEEYIEKYGGLPGEETDVTSI